MPEMLLEISGLKTYYYAMAGVVKAVDDVSFTLKKGETIGLVGESGSGKSTVGFSILRLIPPPGRVVQGSIRFEDTELVKLDEKEMRGIRGKRIGMVFQDPMTSLNPVKRVRDHIIETIQTHEVVTEEECDSRAAHLMKRLGISPDRLTDYPHQFSGGMRQRIMIGLALCTNPDLIIADEPTTALDVIVEAQIMELLKELRSDFGVALMLITHNMGLVADIAEKVAVMYAGKLVEVADRDSLFSEPLHPYTQALLRSIPNIRLTSQKLEAIPGSTPDLVSPPSGCRFHPRCPYVMEICKSKEPPLIEVKPNRLVACYLHNK
jgi:oligopeptide/dipeptide ABC transporter ATP-binding protein